MPDDPAAPTTRSGPRRRWVVVAGVAAALLLLAVAGAAWLLTRDAPAAVDIADAVDQADTATPPATADDATADEGRWVVDTTVGTFSVTESTGTFVGVRVDEELATVGATTAVIRTPEVAGTIALDDTTLEEADVAADLTGLVSDESRRDGAVQRSLGTDANPTATFVLTEPVDLGALPTADDPASVVASGDLTINGVTNPVDVPLEVVVADDVAVVTGAFDVTLADYEVSAPSAPIVLSVADTGTVELQLFLTPA